MFIIGVALALQEFLVVQRMTGVNRAALRCAAVGVTAAVLLALWCVHFLDPGRESRMVCALRHAGDPTDCGAVRATPGPG